MCSEYHQIHHLLTRETPNTTKRASGDAVKHVLCGQSDEGTLDWKCEILYLQ